MVAYTKPQQRKKEENCFIDGMTQRRNFTRYTDTALSICNNIINTPLIVASGYGEAGHSVIREVTAKP